MSDEKYRMNENLAPTRDQVMVHSVIGSQPLNERPTTAPPTIDISALSQAETSVASEVITSIHEAFRDWGVFYMHFNHISMQFSSFTAETSVASEVITSIHEACRDWGVFYITGHGISRPSMDAVMDAARSFFDLPFEKKSALSIRNSNAYRGFIQKGSERTDDKVDVKEGFYCGPDVRSDDPDVLSGTPMLGPNQFPDESDLPHFAEILRQYRNQMKVVGMSLMRAVAMGLNLKKDFFDQKFCNPIALLAMWHYPPHPRIKDSWGVGAHTDHEVITLVLQDDIGGLQAQTKSGEWIEIPPVPGTFVVILGDPLEAWTKGLYRAALHRVKSSSNRSRYSTIFFFSPNSNCVIKPLEINLIQDLSYTPDFLLKMPFRFGDYYLAKFQQSFDWFTEK